MDFSFVMQGADGMIRELAAAGRRSEANAQRAMFRVGTTVKDRAQEYAPISPNEAQKRKAATGTAAQRRAGKKRRKASATTRAKPGTLQNAIRFTATPTQAEIFVPSNSQAGKYAYKMHEEKGKTWSNRGIGTVTKGAQADHKFIERAIRDSEREIDAILRDQMGRGLPS